MMHKNHTDSKCATRDRGFTLVELAISLMVIGLLIGGILKGQELIDNAAITRTVRTFKTYQTAMTMFIGRYEALPGDISNPQAVIPECTAAPCNVAGDDNGVVFMNNAADPTVLTPFIEGWASGGSLGEVQRFFLHLQKAGLISGVDPNGTPSGSPFRYGYELPQAPFEGTGFFAYSIAKKVHLDWTGTYPGGGAVQGMMARPWHARAVDAKLDDGRPSTGDFRAPLTTSCVETVSGVVQYVRNNTVGLNACEPVFKIE